MTGLLVSVRDAEEAAIALRGGADIIDVKEPRNGSLGAADGEVWRQVRDRVAGRTPLSAALGELASGAVRSAMRDLEGFRFAKVGLAGCRKVARWTHLWKESLSMLPGGVAPVAVAYADFQVACAPDPGEILTHALQFKCAALLLDTFDKSSGDLFEHMTLPDLERLIQRAREAGMLVVLAGSLTLESVATALQLKPDFVAVRGAACRGNRSAAIDLRLVRQLRKCVTVAPRAKHLTRVCQANS